jgi:dihydroorotate dehydrogenase
MSEVSKKKKIKLQDHDYAIKLSDRLLAVFKKLFPFPEKRHEGLAFMASHPYLFPGISYREEESLVTTISFPDRSNTLYFGSPFILPAGACKYGHAIAELANLGFGGVTVGTATGEARSGNSFRPRVAMIDKDRAINNAMGLNNPGIAVLAKEVDLAMGKSHRKRLSVGISVAENPEIQDEQERLDDLLDTFRVAYNVADYVEVNVSCPNTGNNRVDADTGFIEKLFSSIMQMRKNLPVRRAVYAKLSPDMNEKLLHATLGVLDKHEVNGLVLFNTFPAARAKYLRMETEEENISVVNAEGGRGGISGRILYPNTFRAVEYIKEKYPRFSIIASGGIDHGEKAWDLLRLGADAVQSYSAVAYRWNAVHKMREELRSAMIRDGYTSMEEFLSRNRNFSTVRKTGAQETLSTPAEVTG